jgi:hypothetical protein
VGFGVGQLQVVKEMENCQTIKSMLNFSALFSKAQGLTDKGKSFWR